MLQVSPSRAGPSSANQQGEIDNALTSGLSEESPHRPSGPNDEELINQGDIHTEPVYGDLSSQELVSILSYFLVIDWALKLADIHQPFHFFP